MTLALSPVHDSYFDALVRCDPVAATDVVLGLLDWGASLAEVVADVLGPAQALVGELWERGEWSVAQEHAATTVTEAAVSAAWVMTARRQLQDGPHVAFACAQGEWHALPSRTAAALAAEAGAHVTVLAPSMPADQLCRRLDRGDVDVLALSCTVAANLRGAAVCAAAAHAAGVPVVAGGRAFAGRPERARAVGADALQDAPQQLCGPAPSAGGVLRLPEEALRLDDVAGTTVDGLFAAVATAHPALATLPAPRQARAHDDLRWLVRTTGAAVLTGDGTVLDEFLAWLLRVHGRAPDDVVLGAADVVADGLEPLAPAGAAELRAAVARAGSS